MHASGAVYDSKRSWTYVPTTPQWGEKDPWPELHPAALYGIVGETVRTLAPHTEADPAALLFTTLTAFGSLIGSGPFVSVGAVRHTPRLFSVVVGASSKARKGQSFEEVAQIFRQADNAAWDEAHIGGLASGEGLIHHLRDRDDEEEPATKRVLIFEAEFARVLIVAGRDNSTVSQIVRDAWDGRPLRVLTRKDPLVANHTHVSLLGHITSEEIEARLTSLEIANGLANRVLFVAAKRSQKLPHGGSLAFDELVALGARWRAKIARAKSLGEISRSDGFKRGWEIVYDAFSDDPGLAGAIIARAEAQTLRLALLYALADGADELRLPHLIAAMRPWTYVEDSVRHIFGRRLGDPTQQTLLDEVRAVYPEGLDRTAQRDLFGRHASDAKLQSARERLIATRSVVEREEKTGGRPRRSLFAVPCDQSDQSDESDQTFSTKTLRSLKTLWSQFAENNTSAKRVEDDPYIDATKATKGVYNAIAISSEQDSLSLHVATKATKATKLTDEADVADERDEETAAVVEDRL